MQFLEAFFKGFLFVIGCGVAVAVITIMIYYLFKSKKKSEVKATVKQWKDYLTEVLVSENFTEAAFIRKLIDGKSDSQYIDTPQGYQVEVEKSISIEDGNRLKAIKNYKIIKVDNGSK